MDDLPIRVPSEEGKRRQVDRPKEPVPYDDPSEDVSPHGWVDPRSHPFALLMLPREYQRSSWVEPWRFGSHLVPSPEGAGSFWLPGLRGSGSHGGTRLPLCRGNGEPPLL